MCVCVCVCVYFIIIDRSCKKVPLNQFYMVGFLTKKRLRHKITSCHLIDTGARPTRKNGLANINHQYTVHMPKSNPVYFAKKVP